MLNSATRGAYQSALDPRSVAPPPMTSNPEILAYEQTGLGPLCLRRRELLRSPGHAGHGDHPRPPAPDVFDRVRVEPVTFVNDLVDEERTDWLFFAR